MRNITHFLSFSLALQVVPALAQVLPGPAEPARIEERLQPVSVPRAAPEVEFPGPEVQPPPAQAGAVQFTLTGIELQGVTVYPPDALTPLYRDLVGQEISLTDIYALRDAITARYRNDGYILSQATIPAQRIRGGIVRLQVIEGFINGARVEAPEGFTDRFGLLNAYAEQIQASRPLQAMQLEQYVYLANDLPGATIRSVLEPATGVTGGADLALVVEQRPVNAWAGVDNRGSRAIGPWQFDFGVSFNSLLGFFEQTTLRGVLTSNTDELRYVEVDERVPVDAEGTALRLSFRRSWSRPGGDVQAFDIAGRNLSFEIAASHPFIRSRAENLTGEVGFTYRDAETTSFVERLFDDRLRILSIGLTYDVADAWGGVSLIGAQVSQGVNIFDASEPGSPNLSRAGGHSDFTRFNLSLSRLQPLPERFSLRLAAEVQYSPVELLASEEFALGGVRFGRAYEPSELTGDSGWAGSIELQYTPNVGSEGLHDAQIYGFYDGGGVWNFEPEPRRGWQYLSSAGAGVRFGITDYVNGSLEVAWPLNRPVAAYDSFGPRVFVSLTARY